MEGECFREGIFIGLLTRPAISPGKDRGIMQIKMLSSWVEAIRRYLQIEEQPKYRNEVRKIKFRATRYTMIGEDLYKRGYSQPFLKCVTKEEGATYLRRYTLGSMVTIQGVGLWPIKHYERGITGPL